MLIFPLGNHKRELFMSENRHPCGLCHYEFIYSAKVCQGCQGEIVYGPTVGEIAEYAKLWAIIWGVAVAGILLGGPSAFNSIFGTTVAVGWGLGLWSILLIVAGVFWGNHYGTQQAFAEHRGKIRTFRRM
jgi:hypothetical protein